MKPRGIVFIAGQLILGGAEQQLYYLLSGLDRSRFSPVVITLGSSEHEYWEDPIRKLEIPLLRVPRNTGRVERTFRIAGILRRIRPQIVHSWVFHANAYAAAGGALARSILRVGSMRESYKGLPDDRFLRWVGCRGLDILVANAAETADEINTQKITPAKVEFVPNGTSIPEQLPADKIREMKQELGFSGSDLIVGTIGRLDANKNHEMLIRSFAGLASRWPTLQLLIIGDGPLNAELRALTARLGIDSRVKFTGRIPGAARYLPVMDICCLTSRTEGMPNLVMEAGAAGVTVVSTRCGDVADLIEDAVSGYLVNVDDDSAMQNHLDALLSSPEARARMGGAGRTKIQKQFSLEAMVDRMSNLYERHCLEKCPA